MNDFIYTLNSSLYIYQIFISILQAISFQFINLFKKRLPLKINFTFRFKRSFFKNCFNLLILFITGNI